MGWESFVVLRFDLGPLVQVQMRIVELKSAYHWLIIGPRVLQCETNLWEIMGWKSDVVGFDLGPLLQGEMGITKLESVYNSLIIDPRGLQYENNLQLQCIYLVPKGEPR